VNDHATVRPMTDDDDLAALNSGNPMAWQAVWWQELSATMDIRWFTGLAAGVPAGFAAVCPMGVAAGGFGAAIVYVLPEYRRRGLGGTLRTAVEEVARQHGPGLIYNYVEGYRDSEAAVRAWGLAIVGRHHESVLNLRAIDRSLYEAKGKAPGVEIAELPIAELDEAAWGELFDFVQARYREAPDSADGGGELPYETFRKMVTAPWMLLTAREEGELVGYTQVMGRPGDPTALNTFFTGVVPASRGRGIATALKTRHALLMADRSVDRLFTQNMEGNEAILAANRTLGFARAAGYADVARPFG
jgi:GNAT superfamily N-acetyltransferase